MRVDGEWFGSNQQRGNGVVNEEQPLGRAQDTSMSPLKLGSLNPVRLHAGFLLAYSFPEISPSHP